VTEQIIEVDPRTLIEMAEPYRSAAIRFGRLSRRARDMNARYRNAWGHDDLGNNVEPIFSQMFAVIEGGTESIEKDLTYHGDGLRRTGMLYAEADDDASQTARSLDAAFIPLREGTPATRASPATDDRTPKHP